MHSTVKRAIEILNWCVVNNATIKEGQVHFGVGASYVRNAKNCYQNELLNKACLDFHASQEQHKPDDDAIDAEKKSFTEDNKGNACYEYDGSEMITSLDQAIAFFKIDTNIWEVERYLCNSYPVSARVREQDLQWIPHPETGNSMMQGHSKRKKEWTTRVNYQVKLWLKKKIERVAALDFEDFYKDLLTKHKPVKYTPVKYSKREKNLLEVNIFDLHLGKLCWGKESGNDYDSKIAAERFLYALDQLLYRSQHYQCERILFPVGNDFFNSDTDTNTTYMGTWQAEDSRWQKTFKTGIELLVKGIDYLRERAPVDILVIPGNHDWTRSFFIGETLSAWYRSDKCVDVNNSPNPRKYYEYGATLLGFTHGNLEKPEALRSLMAFEAKDAWARTRYREFHCGHWHRKLTTKHAVVAKQVMTNEELAIIIRHMGSMAGTDAWHDKMGYKGPNKSAEAFIWNHEDGLNAQFNVNINI